MKKLGEQWIEEMEDGKHMYKAVSGLDCNGCAHGVRNGEDFECLVFVCRVLGNNNLVVKDLGILCDGFLPCSVCGRYPRIYDNTKGAFVAYYYHAICNEKHGRDLVHEYHAYARTIDELRERWNRRA